MKNILVIGAGKSTAALLKYLLENSEEYSWKITLGDQSIDLAEDKINAHKNGKAIQFDVNDDGLCKSEIKKADIVISMLPAHMHIAVAKHCLNLNKNLVTASYISDEMRALEQEVKKKGLLFLNEMGVDPGIDHMSAKKILDHINSSGGEILHFESFTGGLVAPESDNNPWNYKFTWNPRNVVLAGQGGAVKFIQENQYKYIPYHQLFRRTEVIEIEGYGKFEAYANRDSLKYRSIYNLDDIPTIYRGTLRRLGFSRAWNILVQLGVTDDSYVIEDSENMTYRQFINAFLPYHPTDSVELKLRHLLHIEQDDYVWEKLEWLGIFTNKKVGLKAAAPAQILQKILEEKWALEEDDKDMIVMWHKLVYFTAGVKKEIQASMVVKGEDQVYTAMAKTVGMPIAIATKLILNGTIKTTGVKIPIEKAIYAPVLEELKEAGIVFNEKYV